MNRTPPSFVARLAAHCRPQPAIPALLVQLLTLLFAGSSMVAAGGVAVWGVAAGVIVSCALAVAAGFCSFFPPLAWLAVAWLTADMLAHGLPAPWATVLLLFGSACAVAGLALQGWRVRTGRFVVTLS